MEILLSKKAQDVVALDLRGISNFTDFFLIASGDTDKQNQALLESLEMKVKELGHQQIGVEGEKDGQWILYDLGDVIVHIFTPEFRDYYKLEEFWTQAKKKVYI